MIMNITPQNGDRKLIKYKKGDVKTIDIKGDVKST